MIGDFMKYPNYIKDNDTIGVCAPSDGIANSIKQKRLDNAYKKLKEVNLKLIETASVRKSTLGKSNTDEIRAQELEELYTNEKVKAIICASGGDFLLEMLDYINFDIIQKNMKWLQGYSDPTGLLFTITTNYDIATIYGYNIGTYGMDKWHPSIYNNIDLLKGKTTGFDSLDYYEDGWYDYITGLESFHKDKKVIWKNLYQEKQLVCTDALLVVV